MRMTVFLSVFGFIAVAANLIPAKAIREA